MPVDRRTGTAETALAWAESYRVDDLALPPSIEHWDLGGGESQVIAHGVMGRDGSCLTIAPVDVAPRLTACPSSGRSASFCAASGSGSSGRLAPCCASSWTPGCSLTVTSSSSCSKVSGNRDWGSASQAHCLLTRPPTTPPTDSGCEPPQPLSKTAARIEPSRSPAAAANILPRFPNTIGLLQRRFLSGESRDHAGT